MYTIARSKAEELYVKVIKFQNEFLCLQFSKKLTQKFDEFLPKNLEIAQIEKIKALLYTNHVK